MARNVEFDYTEKLEAARNLFWEKGYHATSVHDIVAAMNLNRSSIYNSYGSKQDLFLKCLDNYADFKKDQYYKASLVKSRAIDALVYIVRDVVHQTLTDNKACLIVNTIFELAASDKEVKQLLQTRGTDLLRILEKTIAQAQADGDIKSASSSAVIARYVLSSFSSFWSHYILSQNKEEVAEMVDFFLEQLRK